MVQFMTDHRLSPSVTNDIREDEMEDNMHHVAAIVNNLRNMAIDMGTELETQNKQIGTIYEKVRLV